MEIDYNNLARDVETGLFRVNLEEELKEGFQRLKDADEPLPPASHYAARIAEIVDRGSEVQIPQELSYLIYQEILVACEEARAAVLGEERPAM